MLKRCAADDGGGVNIYRKLDSEGLPGCSEEM